MYKNIYHQKNFLYYNVKRLFCFLINMLIIFLFEFYFLFNNLIVLLINMINIKFSLIIQLNIFKFKFFKLISFSSFIIIINPFYIIIVYKISYSLQEGNKYPNRKIIIYCLIKKKD